MQKITVNAEITIENDSQPQKTDKHGCRVHYDHSILKDGKYIVQVTSEKLVSIEGCGSTLILEYTVLEGPCQGEVVQECFYVDHPDRVISDKAMRAFLIFCFMVGMAPPKSPDVLHGLQLGILLGNRPGSKIKEILAYARLFPKEKITDEMINAIRTGKDGRNHGPHVPQ
jgi:hypothetical protein